MSEYVGTVVRGIKAPIVKEGEDIIKIATQSLINAKNGENFEIKDRDVFCLTESIVARSQGNYATFDDIADDLKRKFGENIHLGILFPIFSRNRFQMILEAVATKYKKITLMLNYMQDEVGNSLIGDFSSIIDTQVLYSENEFREKFGELKHKFTGLDYVKIYSDILKKYDVDYEIVFSNNPKDILKYTNNVLSCDVHSRKTTKNLLKEANIFNLEDILNSSEYSKGYNEEYGLLGANNSGENKIKLFPRDCFDIANKIQKEILDLTGKQIEVMIYGDGAFKDPVGKIWELADPVVSPGYTNGLIGTPNEIKIKYLADNEYKNLEGDDLAKAIKEEIKKSEKENLANLGTTPRQYTDLLGSLADLCSGSGSKGTPFVYIQGYFDTF